MRALVLVEPGRMEVQGCEVPATGAGEILVRVKACGTCATDLKIIKGLRPWRGGCPCLFGHEVTGIVEVAAPDVRNVEVGERVLLRITDTGYAEYCKTKASQAIRLPDSVSFEHGVLGQLMPIAIRGLQKGMQEGDVVLVVGAGAAGLLSLEIARAYGARMTIATDLHERRLEVAREVGADVTLLADDSVHERLREVGEGIDVAVECVGYEPAFRQAEQALRPGGTIVLFGTHLAPVPLDLMMWEGRSLSLVVAREQPHETPALLQETVRLMEEGHMNLAPLISHVVPLEEAAEAFDMLLHRPEEAMKIAIVP